MDELVSLCQTLVAVGRVPTDSEKALLAPYAGLKASVMFQVWTPLATVEGDNTMRAVLRSPSSRLCVSDVGNMWAWVRGGCNLQATYESRNVVQAMAIGRPGFASGRATDIGHNARWGAAKLRELLRCMDGGTDGLLKIQQNDIVMPGHETDNVRLAWSYICPADAAVFVSLQHHVRGGMLQYIPGCSVPVAEATSAVAYRDIEDDSNPLASSLKAGGPWCPPVGHVGSQRAWDMGQVLTRLHALVCPTNEIKNWGSPPTVQHAIGIDSGTPESPPAQLPSLARALIGPQLNNGALYLEQLDLLNPGGWRHLPPHEVVYPLPVVVGIDGKLVDEVKRMSIIPVIVTSGWVPDGDTARANLRRDGMAVAYLAFPADVYEAGQTSTAALSAALQPQLQILLDSVASQTHGPVRYLFLRRGKGARNALVKYKPVLWTAMADLRQAVLSAVLRQTACPTCITVAENQGVASAPLSCPVTSDMRCICATAIVGAFEDRKGHVPNISELKEFASGIGLGDIVSAALQLVTGPSQASTGQQVPVALRDFSPRPPSPLAVIAMPDLPISLDPCDGCLWHKLAGHIRGWPLETEECDSVTSVYGLPVCGFRAPLRTDIGRKDTLSECKHGYLPAPTIAAMHHTAAPTAADESSPPSQDSETSSATDSDASMDLAPSVSEHNGTAAGSEGCALARVAGSGARPSSKWPPFTARPTDTLHELAAGGASVNYFGMRRHLPKRVQEQLDYLVLHMCGGSCDNVHITGFSRSNVLERKSYASLGHVKASELLTLGVASPVLMDGHMDPIPGILAASISDIFTQLMVMLKHTPTINLQQLTLAMERWNLCMCLQLLRGPTEFGKAIKHHAPEHVFLQRLILGAADHGSLGALEGAHGRWAVQVYKATSRRRGAASAPLPMELLQKAQIIAFASFRLSRVVDLHILKRHSTALEVPSTPIGHPGERAVIAIAARTAVQLAFTAAGIPKVHGHARSHAEAAAISIMRMLPPQVTEVAMASIIRPMLAMRRTKKVVKSYMQDLEWMTSPQNEDISSILAIIDANVPDRWDSASIDMGNVNPNRVVPVNVSAGAHIPKQLFSAIYPGSESQHWGNAKPGKVLHNLLDIPATTVVSHCEPPITAGQLLALLLEYGDGDVIGADLVDGCHVLGSHQQASPVLQAGSDWRKYSPRDRQDLVLSVHVGGEYPYDERTAIVVAMVDAFWMSNGEATRDLVLVVRLLDWADRIHAPMIQGGLTPCGMRPGGPWEKLAIALPHSTEPAVDAYCLISRRSVLRKVVTTPDFKAIETYHSSLLSGEAAANPPVVKAYAPLSISGRAYPGESSPVTIWVLRCIPPTGGVLGKHKGNVEEPVPAYCE